MIAPINSVAIVALVIFAIRQHCALRRLRREVVALRRDHHDVQRWYQMLFDGLHRQPALMSPSTINESRTAR